jgi:hypothetical protein
MVIIPKIYFFFVLRFLACFLFLRRLHLIEQSFVAQQLVNDVGDIPYLRLYPLLKGRGVHCAAARLEGIPSGIDGNINAFSHEAHIGLSVGALI